jgi:phytoene dehydrogenase-like protein
MNAPTVDRVDAIVIGAGISGLAAATELAKAGCRTIVLEKSRGIGGRMATRRSARPSATTAPSSSPSAPARSGRR